MPGFRAGAPRFQGENLDRNLALVAGLEPIARGHGITVPQLAVAWVAAQGPDIVPLIGTRQLARVREAQRAAAVELSADELAAIDRLVPAGAAAGERYAAAQLAILDSER